MASAIQQFITPQKAKTTSPIAPFIKNETERADKKTGGISQFIDTKTDLKTSFGLTQLAKQKGLEKEAKKITEAKGEKPQEIWSGGTVNDIFDTLNALQYGVTGLLKGKSFGEGVKTRQSFSDKDALGEYGLPGTIGGIALDIAVDPLTYAGGFGLLKRGASLVVKGAKVAGEAIKKAPVVGSAAEKIGDKLGSMFIYRFGQDPVYAQLAERSIRNIAVGNQNLLDLARPLTKLDATVQKTIAEARKAGKLETLSSEVLAKAKPAFDELDRLGKEAVDAGLLKAETYAENVGKYIARLYRKHEIPEGIVEKVKTIFDKKPTRIDLSRFKKRTDIPDDVREAMGEILEAGYPTAKGLVQLNQAVERAKFFKEVAIKWSKDTLEEGFAQLPKVKSLGKLSGKTVPKPIFDDIQEIIRPMAKGLDKKIVAGFKFSKVIMNPATHARNIMSNFILNDFEGLSPARLDIYGEAAANLVRKGKWYKEAKQVGLGLDTFASREIKDILVGPESASFIKKFGRNAVDKLSDLYQKEEEFAKMAQYIFQRKKGLSPEDAWKVAERATFNYAQVTPFIRKVRESLFGYPFITFTYKATPQIIKTLATQPTKISNLGKIKNAIENMTPVEEREKERAAEPDYMKNGLYVRLPNKDKYGRAGYFDLTYILPFGDIISGQMFETQVPGEAFTQTAMRKLPFLNIIAEISRNKDFFDNDIIKKISLEPHQQGSDLMRYLAKTYLPSFTETHIDMLFDEETRKELGLKGLLPFRIGRSMEFEKAKEERPLEVEKRTTRTVGQEIARAVFGLKVLPFNVERERQKREYELRTRLQDLLEGAGIIKKYPIPYIPK